MKTFLFAGIALLAATPAAAQELTPLGGPRIELRAGWDDAAPIVSYTDETGTSRLSRAHSGLTYGTELGYDVLLPGSGFVGGYAGIEGSTNKTCSTLLTERECLGAGRNITAGVRVGFALPHNSKVYIKGGYSNGRVDYTYRDSAFPADNADLSHNFDGFHVGGGAELGITSHVYTKLEYLYTHYNLADVSSGALGASIDIDRHQVVGGVGYRF
jgi:outer membrane immunogenic protein